MSSAFKKFADAAKLPKSVDARLQWLQQAVQAERQFDQENK
jgi:formiminotetrahydrofolate cyclodeaminase